MNIYLDIDGVLLANDKQAANHVDEFLKYLIDHHEVYWSTTHVHGDTNWVMEYLGRFLSPEAMILVEKIKVTDKDWDVAKTEAMDFSRPFRWLDDDCYPEEHDDLVSHNALDNWIAIDLGKDEDQLHKLVEQLSSTLS